jgi:hypothetical protein
MPANSTFSYSSDSYRSSSSSSNGKLTGQTYIETARSDPTGTTVNTKFQTRGEPVVEETVSIDQRGKSAQGMEGSGIHRARVEDISKEEKKEREQRYRDLQYAERMEDEDAQRQGDA